jgi:hypothetical protein
MQKTRLCQRELLKCAAIDRAQNSFAGLGEQRGGWAHNAVREQADGAPM